MNKEIADTTAITLVEYKEVAIKWPNRILLEDVNLSWKAGSFIYLIGRVGEGKSTLLRTMYHDHPVYKGEGYVANYSLHSLKSSEVPFLRRKLGVVVQTYRLLENQTVFENLSFCLKSIGVEDARLINDKVVKVLRDIDMQGFEDRYPYELSEGERQKVAVARAVVNSPSVVIVDEPTGNLDVQSIKAIMQMLHNYAKDNNSLVVMATHNLQVVREFPGDVYLVNQKNVTNVTERFYSKSKFKK